MALPLFLSELDILTVREDGSRVTIGPKAELAGFRQSDFLKELQVIRRWLRNQTGIEEVVIDVENREYLRGRTLAGLVLLKEDIPEGAEFCVVGESELLDSVLDKMKASDAVPVFPDQASAFDYTPPSRLEIFAARTRSKLEWLQNPRIALAIVLVGLLSLLGIGYLLMSARITSDYHRLLSLWQESHQLRSQLSDPAQIEESLAAYRQQADAMVVRYMRNSSRSEDESQLLEAARALATNLKFASRHMESEQEFLRSMQRIAAIHQISDLPQPATAGNALGYQSAGD